jgi:hypothetical protein
MRDVVIFDVPVIGAFEAGYFRFYINYGVISWKSPVWGNRVFEGAGNVLVGIEEM